MSAHMWTMTVVNSRPSSIAPTVSITPAPGQLVQFHRPSPRGGRGACRGVVISARHGSVVVRCTESTVIGLPAGAQLRLSDREITVVPPQPLSAAVRSSTTSTLREPARGALNAPVPHSAPAAPAAAPSVDFQAVFDDPVERRAARSAFAASQRLLAGAGFTGRYVLARPAMTAGNARELNYVSADGAATLSVVVLRKGAQVLVSYDGPDEAWSRVYAADGTELGAALLP